MSLKPQNLIQAAEADLARRERNKDRYAGKRGDPTELYAFYGQHVRRAADVAHLLHLAIKKPGKALASAKKNTRIIYGDAALLAEALKMLGKA